MGVRVSYPSGYFCNGTRYNSPVYHTRELIRIPITSLGVQNIFTAIEYVAQHPDPFKFDHLDARGPKVTNNSPQSNSGVLKTTGLPANLSTTQSSQSRVC